MTAERAPEFESEHELEDREATVYVMAEHQPASASQVPLTASEAMVAWTRRNAEMGYGPFLIEGGPRPAGDGWHFADSFPGPEA